VSFAPIFAAAAAIAVLSSGVAWAQPGPPEGRYLLGEALSITPAVVFVAGRDTNAIRTNTGTPASEFYVVPQVEGWLGRGRSRFNFASAVEFSRQQTADNVAGRTTNQYHVGRLDVSGARIDVSGVAGFRNHYAPPTDFVGFELGKKSRRIETELGGQVIVRPGGRISLLGNVTSARLRYDADETFEGASLQQNLNRDIMIYGGQAQLAVTPLSSIGGSATFYTDRFLYAPARDGDGLRLMFGGQFSPQALIAGRAEVGYLKYKTVISRAEYGGPAYLLGLSVTRAPFFLDVSGRRTIEYSFDPGQGFYVSDGIDLYSALALGTRWEIFGRGSVRGMEPRGPLAAQEPFRALQLYKAGLARSLGQLLKLGADVERYVTGGPGGFDGVRATLFLVYGGTTRLQRLDRPLPGGF
jgi:hypothetical protein